MTKYLTSFWILLLFISGTYMVANVNGSCDYLSTSGGGCPDVSVCLETCRPCYRGIGTIQPYCVAPTGVSPYWECRCQFKNGAPCPPIGPPRCPAAWPRPPPLANRTTIHQD